MRAPRRVRAAVLLACALLAATGAGAVRADPEVWESEWSFALRSGRVVEATNMLSLAAAKELVSSPKHLYLSARSGAIHIAPTLQRGIVEPLTIGNWFTNVGAEARKSEAPTAQLSKALAAVAGLTCRLAGAIGSGAGPDEANAVAEHTLAFYRESAASDGGAALVDALGWIRAVLFVDHIDPAPIVAIQQGLYDQLAAKAAGALGLAAKAELEFARAAAIPEAAAAKAGVERGLGLLKSVVSVTPPPPDAARLVNELLNFAADRKLGVRGDYVTEKKTSTDGRLRVGLPLGLGWTSTRGSSASCLSVTRLGRGSSLYSIEIHSYDAQRTHRSFVTGEAIMGSDLKAVATQRFEMDQTTFESVASAHEPKPSVVARSFGPGLYYEVMGTDSTAEKVARRGWILKGKVHAYTYCLLVIDYSGSEDPPAELLSVVESIAELKAPR